MKEIEVFKEHKTNICVPCILAVLVISLSTPVTEAALDIDQITITSCKNYVDGTPETHPWTFEIWVDVLDPGNLDHIDVTPPVPATPFTLFKYDSSWEWDAPSHYSSLANLRVDYPEGIYTFEFRDISDVLLDTVSFNYSGLPGEPSMPVDFTYPSVDGQTGISINPTITWTVDAGAGDTLTMVLGRDVIDDDIYWDGPVSMTTSSWTPGPLQAGQGYWLDVSVLKVKDWVGPDWPTETTAGGDGFRYALEFEYLNMIDFTTIPANVPLLGWVWMDGDDFGYSLDEGDLLYFHAPEPILTYNFTTGLWGYEGPVGWTYIDWPFFYVLDADTLMFAWPPEIGLWVYHFSTGEWTVLPRILP